MGRAAVVIDDIAQVMAKQIGVPVDRLAYNDRERLLNLEHSLSTQIIGHSHVLSAIAETLRRNAAGFRTKRPIGSFLFLGPTGVGKTTTIAKLAAKYILKHGSKQVALITTDNYRIGAHEQLSTYGKLLNVPVKIATNAEELSMHINSFHNKRLILIDTAGMSQRDMRLADQIQTLQQNDVPIKTYLVMSASTQHTAMNEIINVFKVFEPEASILTKLDETVTLGSTLSSIIEHQLPVAFMTNGQQVPEDIYFPDSHTLINQCVEDLEEENDYAHELKHDEWVAEGYA
jgi:flagellar biosynthesis protein FlhF